jgi:serine/threonine-protein kinase
MKTSRIPASIFGLLLIANIVFLVCTISLLPQQMATHFDAGGHSNGWMSRSSAVVFQGIIGLILPLIIAVAFCALRFVPTRGINFPNRDFWFAPERHSETCTYLSRQGLWLANLLVLLQGMVWYQLIESNAKSIPHLSSSGFLVTLGVFGAAMIVWVMRLFSHFRKAA